MRRILSAVTALLVVAGITLVAPSSPSSATVTWPIVVEDMKVMEIIAHENGGLTAYGCNTGYDGPPAVHVGSDGEETGRMPGTSSQFYCQPGSYLGTSDGTLYGAWMSTTSELVAWRDGSSKWSVDITSPTNCASSGTVKSMWPRSISQGPDGNIYMVLTPNVSPQACEDRLFGVDKDTGRILIDEPIGSLPVDGINAQPAAWTFSDKIIVIDRSLMLREFDYEGTEDTGAQYDFPLPSGHGSDLLQVNSEGTAFVVGRSNSYSGSPTLYYHTDDGYTGAITDTVGGQLGQLHFTSDGNVVGLPGGAQSVHRFDIGDPSDVNDDSVTGVSFDIPSGYTSSWIDSYAEDTDGNIAMVRGFYNSSTQTSALTLDIGDSDSINDGDVSNMFTLTQGPNLSQWYASSVQLADAIVNDYAYVSVCHDVSANCYHSTAEPDTTIHKVELTGFGEALREGYSRTTYTETGREYVAMGDSFSSGEGNEPFYYGSATDTINECHRTEKAYPSLLASDEELDLELTGFVACSGATTANVMWGGQWNEPAQIDALSDTTDVVTITIGGNDVGFASYMKGCVPGCGPVSGPLIYDAMMDGINAPAFKSNLMDTYEAILDKAPNADVYVVGYPFMTYDGQLACAPIDTTGAYSITVALNSVIENAIETVDDTRLKFVDSSLSGSPFTYGYICSGIPQFNYLDVINEEYSYHPNQIGQESFWSIVREELD